jgi:hypothetical protein
MTKTYKSCQSCAIPFKFAPENGGTEADGTKSTMYCSYCYKDGQFTDDCKTAQEMQKLCMENMVKTMKYPKFIAWLFTRSIPKLERWRKKVAHRPPGDGSATAD